MSPNRFNILALAEARITEGFGMEQPEYSHADLFFPMTALLPENQENPS